MEALDIRQLEDVESAAQYILGSHIIRTLKNGEQLVARIVEVEAYHETDPASHTYHGVSDRNRAMFGPPARAYIYFTYGMHYCFNITCGKDGEGTGVLVRAIEPIQGIDSMRVFRRWDQTNNKSVANLTNGPAKTTQALKIDKSLYGHNLAQPPLQVFKYNLKKGETIAQSRRIGIKKAVDTPWRFYISDNPYVSKAPKRGLKFEK